MLGIRSEQVVAAARMALHKRGLLAVSTVTRGLVGAAAAEAATSQMTVAAEAAASRIADTQEAGNGYRETES